MTIRSFTRGTLAGTVAGDIVTIPPGAVIHATGPLTIKARRTLILRGTLIGAPGSTIRLVSNGSIVVVGAVSIPATPAATNVLDATTEGVRTVTGAAGVAGGDVILAAPNVTIGPAALIKAGAGGAGAAANVFSAANAVTGLVATGGRGGRGGDVRVESPTGAVKGTLLAGDAGAGGPAIADARRTRPSTSHGVNATARGGKAGRAGEVVQAGVETILAKAAAGGAATAKAGDGAQPDGYYCGTDGATGTSQTDSRPSGSGQSANAIGTAGGGGGYCTSPGGNRGKGGYGGDANAYGGDGSNGCPGGKGGDASAQAGMGIYAGSGATGSPGSPGTPGTLLTNGSSGTDGGTGGDGGNGGDAGNSIAYGGYGGQGYLCFGGDGGAAISSGNNGGDAGYGGRGGDGGSAGCAYTVPVLGTKLGSSGDPGQGGAGGQTGWPGYSSYVVASGGVGGGSGTWQGKHGGSYPYYGHGGANAGSLGSGSDGTGCS